MQRAKSGEEGLKRGGSLWERGGGGEGGSLVRISFESNLFSLSYSLDGHDSEQMSRSALATARLKIYVYSTMKMAEMLHKPAKNLKN